LKLIFICLQDSDGVIVIENDQINAVCSQLLNIKRPSFGDLNQVISRNLAALFLPSGTSSGRRVNLLGDPLQHMCCHPVMPGATNATNKQCLTFVF